MAGRVPLGLTVLLHLASSVPALAGSDVIEIEKFHRVDGKVSTGAQPTAPQLAALKREGVRTVINLREPSEYDSKAEESAAADLGLKYVPIPVRTADPKDEQVEAFLAATADPGIFPVFIHCGSGNRVGAFWMIRRVLVDGWSFSKAEQEARQIGLKSPNLLEFAADYVARHGPKKD